MNSSRPVQPGTQRAAVGKPRAGFSLVEITVAIAIVGFAVLTIVALLPIGIGGARDAYEEGFATQIIKSLSASLQRAARTAASTPAYMALAPYNNAGQGALLQWTVGTAAQAGQTIYIGYDGQPTTDKSSARLIACIQITPPSDLLSPGCAYVCLAWPPAGITTPVAWQNGRPQLANAQGYVEAVVYFLPQS